MENENRNVPVVGKYKVAWWAGSNTLQAKMFDTLDGARLFMMNLSKGTVSTVMESQSISNGSYTWKLLPDGVGKIVPAVSWVYKNRKPVGIAVVSLLVYRAIFK